MTTIITHDLHTASQTAPPAPTATGSIGWWSSFLQLVPLVGTIAWIVTTVVVHAGSRGLGAAARGNTRNALNWMLTAVIGWIVIIGSFVGLLQLTGEHLGSGTLVSSSPLLFVPLGLAVAWAVCGLVFAIRGGVVADRGAVYRAPLALPIVTG